MYLKNLAAAASPSRATTFFNGCCGQIFMSRIVLISHYRACNERGLFLDVYLQVIITKVIITNIANN